jgi:hypothetical protein
MWNIFNIKENMEHIKYQMTISPLPQHSKPSRSDNSISNIYKNLNEITYKTVNEIATIVQQPYGYTWSGGSFNGLVKDDTWISQSVIGLDFDNKDTTIRPEDVVKRIEEYGITPQVWYQTFSSTDQLLKFRMMLLLDESITDPNHHQHVMKGLKSFYPEADQSCFNRARYFFAGTKSEVISQDPISTQKLTELASIQGISVDKGRTRSIAPFKGCSWDVGEEEKIGEKTEKLYDNNKSGGNSPKVKEEKPLRVNWEEARKKVRILDEFMNGKWLYHNELRGLATNLLKAEGGRKLINETMEKYNKLGSTIYTKNNFSLIRYLAAKSYPPQPINTFSAYDEDQHIYDFATEVLNQRGKIQILEDINRISVEEAVVKLENHFEKVLNSGEKGKIHLIKVPTALGKTELLTKVNNATLAFPTAKLKEEVTRRMAVPCQMTPNQIIFQDGRINNIIDHYYSMGLYQKAVGVLHKVASGNLYNDSEDDIIKATEYIKQLQECRLSDKTVLTTHTRAIHTEFRHNTLIFDEDPIGSLVQINQIKISDLFTTNLTLDRNMQDLSNVIEILTDAKRGAIMSSPKIAMNLDELIQKLSAATKVESNVFGFFGSSFYVKDSLDPNLIHYVSKKELPKDKNIIILSATINSTIYKLLFGERIEIFDIGEVEQMGKVIQYTKRSCSRNGLGKYSKQISKLVGDKNVITFKSFTNQFMNGNKEIYFGNCSGYDSLAGENLAIVGTPHRNNVEYLLLAVALGTNFKTSDTTMGYKEVVYNGFKFMFNCYDQEELREIQLGLIESDLIQAVGRARTLRTEAVVELYSNFPLRISDKFIW